VQRTRSELQARAECLEIHRIPACRDVASRLLQGRGMVPISRGKQIAGIIGAVAFGYTLSWISMPGTGTGPVDTFGPNFGQSVTPVIVAPDPTRDNRSLDPSEPLNSSPKPLQANAAEPI